MLSLMMSWELTMPPLIARTAKKTVLQLPMIVHQIQMMVPHVEVKDQSWGNGVMMTNLV
ncbi:hypothetical protein I3843_16G045900 [Carya illinoinensis]|nr:hypothetical protein I3843_16G045900 [Carya illinoinensis]